MAERNTFEQEERAEEERGEEERGEEERGEEDEEEQQQEEKEEGIYQKAEQGQESDDHQDAQIEADDEDPTPNEEELHRQEQLNLVEHHRSIQSQEHQDNNQSASPHQRQSPPRTPIQQDSPPHHRLHQETTISPLQTPLQSPKSTKHNLSQNRLTHLQQIFKHYCTHIFRVGKHMTFERLEYERVHMTIERFFVFLKDFELTTGTVGDSKKPKEIVPKANIITLFKKVSPNSKDLTFEQFINCLERIAVVFHDNRRSLGEEDRSKVHIAPGLKKVPKRRHINEKEEAEAGEERGNEEKVVKRTQEQEQGRSMNSRISKRSKIGGVGEPESSVKVDQTSKHQKLEMLYKKIGVDSAKDYRNKMGELNLPLFRPPVRSIDSRQKPTNLYTFEQDSEIKRMEEIRDKMRKLRSITPGKSTIINEELKKMQDQLIERRQQSLLEKKEHHQQKQQQHQRVHKVVKPKDEDQYSLQKSKELKKVKKGYDNTKITWEISNVRIEQLGNRKFDPSSLFIVDDEDDEKYLAEYSNDDKVKESSSQKIILKNSQEEKPSPSQRTSEAHRRKSMSQSPYSEMVSSSRIEKIVTEAKQRAVQMKRQEKEKVVENGNHEILQRLRAGKYLGKKR